MLFIAILAGGFALPQKLVILSTPEYLAHHKVQDISAAQMKTDSAEAIYYYDNQYILAGMDENTMDKYSRRIIQKSADLPLPGRLYIVSPNTKRPEVLPGRAGEVWWNLESSVLLLSRHDVVALREAIISPFVMVYFTPLVMASTSINYSEIEQVRTEISSMVSIVNADSVMWFIQSLQDFQTRYAFAPNRLAVATWIRDQFIRVGVTDSYLQPFQWNGTTQYNVVATIPGTINPDRFVIVGGHHDSIVSNGSPMTFAPGADDNASGTTAALEMARVMMTTGFQPKNSIRFVTFAAEEFGLWGSKHYAQDALENSQEIVLMINHDMIGHSTQSPSNWQVRIMPYDGSIQHSQYAAQLTQQYTTLSPTYGQMNLSASDSHSFWTRGYPVTYFFEQTFCPYYHSDLDITDYVNGPYCAEVIRASVALASTYGMMVSAPGDVVVNDTGMGNSLRVSWNNSLDPDVVSYRVYYNTTGSNFQNPVTVSPMTGEVTWYDITGLTSGTTYFVAVSALDVDGNESYMVYGQGTPNLIPLTPHDFHDEPGMGYVRLRWEPNQELDLMGYYLYKTSTPGENEEQLGGLLDSEEYTDTDFANPHAYVYYRIVAVDLAGNQSTSTAYVRSRQVSLDKGILVIDETIDGSGINPFQPTGNQVFEFVDGILSGYVRDHLDLEVAGDLRLADIGIYQSIFWHGFDQSDFDSFYLYRDELARYLDLGGNIFFTSYYPTQAVELNSGYPATFASNRFINQYLGIGSADYTTASRFKYAVPANQNWPSLTVDPAKTTASMNGHIFKVESIGAASHAENIYFFGSDYEDGSGPGSLNGMPVGVYYDLNPGQMITISFPLYNMDMTDAQELVNYVFGDIFNSPVANQDHNLVPVSMLKVNPGFPNPFVRETAFNIEVKNPARPVQIQIYNLKGQLVRNLWKGLPPASKSSITWDGFDERNQSVPSGVYLLKLQQDGHSTVRKVMKIR